MSICIPELSHGMASNTSTKKRFLQMRRQVGEWQVPRRAHEALISLLTSLLWGGFFKEKYAAHLAHLISDPAEREEFDKCLAAAFGEVPGELTALVDGTSMNRESAGELAGKLRTSLKKTCLKKKPGISIYRFLKHWYGEARCYLIDPPGISIKAPRGALPRDLASKDGIYATTGNFYGGIVDMRGAGNEKLTVKDRLDEQRAKGRNFIVVRDGENWSIDGETDHENDEPSAFLERIARFNSRRIPSK